MAVVDAYGDTLNTYIDRAVGEIAPARPWAMYLAGADQRFRFLAFDLDAHGDAAAPLRDLDVLTGYLADAGIPFLVCESGPAGGRHIWVGLAESIDADTVATLNRLVKHLCPSLDLSPLSNPRTGCVRPPGAPHRDGGASVPLTGSLDVLTAPQTSAAAIRDLISRLAALVDDAEPADSDRERPSGPIPVDAHRRLYLPGQRRELPAVSAAALQEFPAGADASAQLWRVLVGAAAARWHHADVAALVDDAAGLEHVRTRTTPRGRTPRRRGEQAAILARQWDKAVRYVATSTRQMGDDPTFDRRADAIAAHVRDVQQRADAAAGRWTTGGGPADRRVLDVLSVLALRALKTAVEADIRRVALLAGIGRETARTALLRLAGDGWVAQVAAAEGPRAAHWTIDPKNVFHSNPEHARSQADPRPPGAGAAERTQLLITLTTRITDTAHDLFTSARPALGHFAGNLYARISHAPQLLDELARATGAGAVRLSRTLDRLTYAGIVDGTPTGWMRSNRSSPDAAATATGVAGRLAARAARYRIEREVWAWWKAEEAWMRAPRRSDSSRRPGRGQLSLVPGDGTHAYGPHPRGADGRLDFAKARRIVENERAGTAARDTAPPQRSKEHAPTAERPPAVDEPASTAERLITELLDGRLIGIETLQDQDSAIA
ncbi:hypothetical protein [Microbacterium arborescens]